MRVAAGHGRRGRIALTANQGWRSMAKIIETATGAMALTFDDVLLQPAHSVVMPGQTDVRTRIARDIDLNSPILSAAM
ncbi:IMP dehydrogenase, partial [Vogesella mureinivorans]|uniref:IMP dehydrogenase n=1 Tax=Vogesella mureinivorans TaxID=657276 RepID=UPI0030B874F0